MNTAPHDDPPPSSRYREVTRRLFLRRAAQAVGAAAVLPWLTSCGGDAEVFATTTTVPGDEPQAQAAVSSSTAAPTTTSTTTSTTTTTATPDTGSVVAGEAVIAFSYVAAETSGRVLNPYVAVWIEDSGGELVNTVALWFLQSQKGLRWLDDLRRWYSVDGTDQTIDQISSATRTPGDYTVVWDLTDDQGLPVVSGEYYICIEAAREHGPYSLIREPVTLSPDLGSVELTDDGELQNAVISLNA